MRGPRKRRYGHDVVVDVEDHRVVTVVRGRGGRHLVTLRMLPREARQIAKHLLDHARKLGRRGSLVLAAILLAGIVGCGDGPQPGGPPALRPCSDFGFTPESVTACGERDGLACNSCAEMPRNIPDCLVGPASLCVADCSSCSSADGGGQ